MVPYKKKRVQTQRIHVIHLTVGRNDLSNTLGHPFTLSVEKELPNTIIWFLLEIKNFEWQLKYNRIRLTETKHVGRAMFFGRGQTVKHFTSQANLTCLTNKV